MSMEEFEAQDNHFGSVVKAVEAIQAGRTYLTEDARYSHKQY